MIKGIYHSKGRRLLKNFTFHLFYVVTKSIKKKEKKKNELMKCCLVLIGNLSKE